MNNRASPTAQNDPSIARMTLRDEFPSAIHAIRKALVFEVVFSSSAGSIKTLEGIVSYPAGTPIVTGVRGEQWPVSREHFMATYEPVTEGQMGQNGRYRRPPSTVLAFNLKNEYYASLPGCAGILHGKAGDWLLEDTLGHRRIIDAEIFDETYERAG